MKPSELIRIWMMHAMYNPEGNVPEGELNPYKGTRYLCNVHCYIADGPEHKFLRAACDRIEARLKTLGASVLANHFKYNLGIEQTLENSREFWSAFANELEAIGQ
jgi:hypothetical protein